MTKSVDIENCLASSKLEKYFKKKIGNIFFKIFENQLFLKISVFQLLKIANFQIFKKKSSQVFFEIFLQF